MKKLLALLVVMASTVAIAGEGAKQFALPAPTAKDGGVAVPVTICTTTAVSAVPKDDDVLAVFPINDVGTQGALTRANAVSIVANVSRSLSDHPELADAPEFSTEWLEVEHWKMVETCGLGHQERVSAPASTK